jgi:hypothetical protein
VQRHQSVQLRDFEQVDDPRVRRGDAHPAADLFHRAGAHDQHPQAGAVDEFEPAQIEDQFAATRFKLLPDLMLDGGELVAEHQASTQLNDRDVRFHLPRGHLQNHDADYITSRTRKSLTEKS